MRILLLAATAAVLCVPAGVAYARTVPIGGQPSPPKAMPTPPRLAPAPVVKPPPPKVAPPKMTPPRPKPPAQVTPPPAQVKPLVQATTPQQQVPPPAVSGGQPATLPPPGISPSGLETYPAGCRDLDIDTSQKSFLFHTKIYKFHQIKHWCWRKGVIYDERHAWSFDGGSTACFDEIYPDNHWTFTWWHGIAGSGDFSEERAHVTNCVFHIGDWKEFYPDVKIWAYADGTYELATAN